MDGGVPLHPGGVLAGVHGALSASHGCAVAMLGVIKQDPE